MVMSCGMCKNVDSAVAPFQVETLEDRVDDSIDAGHVHKPDHGLGTPTNLHKNTLNHVSGSQFQLHTSSRLAANCVGEKAAKQE